MNHTARYVGHLITKGRFRKRNDFQKTAGASALPRATRFDSIIIVGRGPNAELLRF